MKYPHGIINIVLPEKDKGLVGGDLIDDGFE
jgi:hypothetical protein